MATSTHRELVERLVRDVRPVRRLWPPALRLALWLVLAALVVLSAARGGLRPDLAARLRDPVFLLEIAAMFGGSALLASLTFRSAVPGREPGRRERGLAFGLVALAALLCLRLPAETNLALSQFIDAGAACAARTVLLAALPWCALLIALRRGAPLAPGAAGALAGAAAFVMAFGVMRLACTLDDVIHILMWHATPVAAGMGVSLLAGIVWLRRWRS